MKIKKLYFRIFLPVLFSTIDIMTFGQSGSIGIGVASPDPSAVLDVTSTTKGVLLPRLTLAQRNAISSPANGLLIYQTDNAQGFYYYLGGWQAMTTPSASAANRNLSNLQSSTAINLDLLPTTSGTVSLGSIGLNWRELYLSGDMHIGGNRFVTAMGTNNFFGSLSGNTSVTGYFNTATGFNSLANVGSGNWNTANGYQALFNMTNAISNTGVGFQALYSNTIGGYNTGVGVLSLISNTVGMYNAALGESGLNALNSGDYNSALGSRAGANLSSGNSNTFLGALADVQIGATITNATAVGYNTSVNASNTIRLGNASITSIGGQVNWTAISDGRFKRNVKENVPGLSFINQLRPVTYNLDATNIETNARQFKINASAKNEAGSGLKEITKEEIRSLQEKSSVTYTGFIAQEVEAAANKLGYKFSGVDVPKNEKDVYGLRYAEFVVPLVKAVQELNNILATERNENEIFIQEVAEQKKILNQQKELLSEQQRQINELKTMVLNLQEQVNSKKPK